MNKVKLLMIFPAFFILLFATGCDNDNNNGNAVAQPAPMSGTDVTGTVNSPSEQTCPANIMIEGFKAQDMVILEIDITGSMMGEATITNSSEGTSAKCFGMVDGPQPAEIMSCTVSATNIAGIAVNDILAISVAFSSQTKGVEFINMSGQTGLECAFLTLETLNVN